MAKGNGGGQPIYPRRHDPTDKPRILDFEGQRWWGTLEAFHDEISRMEAAGYVAEVLHKDGEGRTLAVKLHPPRGPVH